MLAAPACTQVPDSAVEVSRPPRIRPDYVGVVVPANIAPLNFIVEEPGVAYFVEISAPAGATIRLASDTPDIRIPATTWRQLLAGNRGHEYSLRVTVKDAAGAWTRFAPIVNRIAAEPIDSHVAYRLINPAYYLWERLGIYQRNLETFDERAVFVNSASGRGCVNCHAFCRGDPDTMLFHLRKKYSGTVLVRDGEATKVDTAMPQTLGAGAYPSWHPSCAHVAFSVNKVRQTFHAAGPMRINVRDEASGIIVYDRAQNTVTAAPTSDAAEFDNLPNWSADGESLFFIRGRRPAGSANTPVYDLMRMPYDADARRFGIPHPVLTAADAGGSISWPKPSPDGRLLLFTRTERGYFAIHHRGADLHLLDLKTGTHTPVAGNSDEAESYHSWSSNSRWYVVASKRRDSVTSRLYFGYIDREGKTHKPFLLPQQDPHFYDTYLMNYNVPELITGPVRIGRRQLLRAARSTATQARFAEP